MNEKVYQRGLIQRIRKRFYGCVILKNDAASLPGVPDILILFKDAWAMLEVKTKDSSPKRPNQKHYIDKFNKMSFASFINPDNEEEVLDAIQSTFGSNRKTRVSKSI